MQADNQLSEREIDILRLVATGASNKEIAQQLFISPNTVKVHLRNIFIKIGVVSRTEATLYAIKIGLIPEAIREITTNGAMSDSEAGEGENQKQGNMLGNLRTGRGLLALVLLILIVIGFARTARFGLNPTQPGASAQERWRAMAELPAPLAGAAVERFEGVFFLAGGENSQGVNGEVFAYDSNLDAWSERAAKPTPVKDARMVVLGDKLFMPGGMMANGQLTDVVEYYDPLNDRWGSAAPLPVALGGYALAAFEGRMYLFGGWNGSQFVDTVWMYDPGEDRWSRRQPLPNGTAWAAAAVLGSKIFLVGGETDSGVQADFLAYYPNRDLNDPSAWEEKPPLPQARKSLSAVTLADGIYIASGVDQTNRLVAPILRFNEAANTWEVLGDPPQPPTVNMILAATQTRLHLMGGAVSDAVVPYHQAYQAIFTVVLPAVSR
jgi:DNA-binding CsgD family transcriptional regulator/N-acetylneuraminic acid mutarotase